MGAGALTTMPKRNPPFLDRFRRLLATEELDREGFRRLFDQEASAAYQVLTRDQTGPEPEGEIDRLAFRTRVLFQGIVSHLRPARRVLFTAALVFFVLGLLDFHIQIPSEVTPGWEVSLQTDHLWTVLGFGSLLFLFALEMVDRVQVRDELEVARALQAALLPTSAPELPGYRFAHSWRTANAVGGDSYQFRSLDDGRLALMVGDASGHGMAAGLVMAIAHATLDTALDLEPECPSVHRMLNRAIYRTGDRRTFMSLFYALLDPATGQLEHVGSGHPFPYLRRADGRVEELGKGGFPLGLRESLPARPETTHLEPGDLLVLYSDGLVEALSAGGEAFGFARLRALLDGAAAQGPLTAPALTAQGLHDRILAAFDRHTEGEPLRDDLTLLVVEREPELPPLPPG